MLRRHVTPIVLTLTGLFLLGTACVVRTHPDRRGRAVHSHEKHEKHAKHKKHSKHKKHKRD